MHVRRTQTKPLRRNHCLDHTYINTANLAWWITFLDSWNAVSIVHTQWCTITHHTVISGPCSDRRWFQLAPGRINNGERVDSWGLRVAYGILRCFSGRRDYSTFLGSHDPQQHLSFQDVSLQAPPMIHTHLKQSKTDQLGRWADIFLGLVEAVETHSEALHNNFR